MQEVNFKKEVLGEVETYVAKVTEKLKDQGFGILNRIDLHTKIKEKINKDIRPTVILGACNPQLAYEAFLENPDVASLLPCNAVIRDIGEGRVSVELAKPTFMMKMLGDLKLVDLAKEADRRLSVALSEIE